MTRREFLRDVAALGAGAALLRFVRPERIAAEGSAEGGRLARRPYGRNGIELSIIGFGGMTLVRMKQEEADRIVRDSVRAGVNYFDVAPTYGNAESLLGPALKPYRRRVFLACKTNKRTRQEAAQELRRSLELLQTDHFDLYQLHALAGMSDVEAVFAKGGAMEALIEARRDGLVRHLGFSAHSVKAALEALDRFDFDSILFPVNFQLALAEGFGPQVIEKATRKGVTCLALKACALDRFPSSQTRAEHPNCWYRPIQDDATAEKALRFTLSQPVCSAIPPGDQLLFRRALASASRFTPITAAETEELRAVAREQNPLFSLDA